MPAALSRRTLLGLGVAALAGAAAGCGDQGRGGAAAATSAAGSAPGDVAAAEQALIAAYDAVLPRVRSRDRRLVRRLRAQHVEHLARLGGAPVPSVAGSAAPAPAAPATVAGLLASERGSGHDLGRQAATAAASLAPVLASIAASHAAHAVLLGGVEESAPEHRRSGKRQTGRRR